MVGGSRAGSAPRSGAVAGGSARRATGARRAPARAVLSASPGVSDAAAPSAGASASGDGEALAGVPWEPDAEHLSDWHRYSWRERPILQQPNYPDRAAVEGVVEELQRVPPLVFAGEVRRLQQRLAAAAEGNGFVLFGGDCAESFDNFSTDGIRDLFRVILQMSVVLMYGASTPVVKVGRVAGQFAKPRSSDTEMVDGVELPSYRGDIINGPENTPEARVPDPKRLVRAYNQSAATLNLLRAFASGGYASLLRMENWELDFVRNSEQGERFHELAAQMRQAIKFMEAAGVTENSPAFAETEFYTSHECLLMDYESTLTREDSTTGLWYNCSAHLVWTGERTRQLDGAHIEFMRGIANPVGVKISDKMATDELIELVRVMNPNNTPGRLTLITRMGAEKLRDHLPRFIRAIKEEGAVVTWVCDPMHGNTITSTCGRFKTRNYTAIKEELEAFFDVHEAEGSHPGGMHLEMTGADVTECVGGASGVSMEDLDKAYETHCDPRLNCEQALEVAFMVADRLQRLNKAKETQA